MSVNLVSGGGWVAGNWADINEVIKKEAAQVRVVQKVFPAAPVSGASYVPAETLNLATMRIDEGVTRRLVEMQGRFQLTQTQVESEATNHAGLKLARLVAKTLALAEDLVLLQGKKFVSGSDVTVDGAKPLTPNVQLVDPGSVEIGLVDEAQGAVPMPSGQYPADFVQEVLDGVARLTELGEPGPYALLMADDAYGKLYQAQANSSVTYGSIIKQIVTGGLYPTGALRRTGGWGANGAFGLLASLSGESVSIYVGSEPCTAFVQTDINGVLQFRVFERVQYVVRNKQALLRLEFA
jgi:uncharacterized linocin/CFP29 family protein